MSFPESATTLGQSDRCQRGVAVQAEDGRPPSAREDTCANLHEARADQLCSLAEVPKRHCQNGEHLLLASLDAGGIQVAGLQQGEELLRRRGVVAVRSGDHRRDLQRGQRLACLRAPVVGGAVEDKDGIVPQVRILAVELAGQPMKESAEDATVIATLAEFEVGPVDDDRQPIAERLRQLSEAFAGGSLATVRTPPAPSWPLRR